MKIRKWISLTLTVAMLLPVLFGCSAPADNQTPTTTTPQESEPVQKTANVLFIGNSYTNETMPKLFKEFAQAAGYDINVYSVVKGSWELTKFADPQDEYGKVVESHLTGRREYDYVILQEKSILTATPELPKFYTAVRNLHARIQTAGAQTILYSTWGRKAGSTALTDNNLTNESMTWKVAAAYQAMGKELNTPVAYVGLAFYDIYTGDSNIEIYDSDKTHPSYAGNYLSAVTLFTTIFQVDPTTVAYDAKLPAEDAQILREAAKRTVFETPEIPAEYKTSSEGIG
ncbi:MAG: hypothetical protein E7439_00260 [Ruminococcaceae bacterium]|nr:hypothetical protein [Oscillospiraceae bacterium]